MWVNYWTVSNGKKITKKRAMLREQNMLYLLLYTSMAEDFVCQLFSTYSPTTPEDKRVVSVVSLMMSGKHEGIQCIV